VKQTVWFFLVAVLAGGWLPCPAQVLPFRNWRPDDGLASSQVWAVSQDSQGYVWIGCTGGLSRFNGRHFVTYRDEQGVLQNVVESVGVDRQGRLWAGTFRGPCVYEPERDRFRFAQDLGGRVRRMVSIGGDLYLMAERAVYRLGEDDTWAAVGVPGMVDPLAALATDGVALYAATTTRRVFRFDPAKPDDVRRYDLPVAVNDLRAVAGGDLWVGTDAGLYFIDHARGALTGPVSGSADYRILTLVDDNDGTIWAGTTVSLLHWDGDRMRRYDTGTGLVGVPVWSSFRDREGNLWFGTNHGVSLLANRQTEIFDSRAGLPGRSVIAVTWDAARRRVWCATTEGLYFHADGRIQAFPDPDGYFRRYYVWTILPTTDGRLWLSTDGGGIVVVDGGSRRTLTAANGLAGDEVLDLYADPDGTVWACGRQGLSRIAPGGIQAFTQEHGLPVNYVRRILRIPGRPGLYLGTIGGGFVHFDGRKFTPVQPPGDDSLLSIYDMIWLDDRLWLATNQGVYIWRGERRFTHLGLEAGLPNLSCTVFLKAGENLLWLGTDSGAALLDTRSERVIRTLTTAHGLAGDEFTTHHSATVDGEGNFWFGLFGGASRISRALADPSRTPAGRPQVALDRMEVTLRGGQRQLRRQARDLALPAGVRSIRFVFDVLWFQDPQNIRVSSKLSGFDDNFTTPGQVFQREYTNLPAGEYALDVHYFEGPLLQGKARLASLWIAPPFWQNPLFQLLAAILVCLLIFLLFRWRLHAIEQEKEHLSELVRTATHELEKKNTLLSRLATTDELTGLFNRRYFLRSILQECRRLVRSRPGESLTLLMLDIDHFKAINDAHGHEVGDRVLQHVARCLRSGLRTTDCIARFGGEEFLVLLPQTPLDGGKRVAEKIRLMLEYYPVEHNDLVVPCTVSIGVTSVTSPVDRADELPDQLIRTADELMYRAKQQGRNCTVAEPMPPQPDVGLSSRI
jgi:diguanylate cyclase (GGDEF)-like protein